MAVTMVEEMRVSIQAVVTATALAAATDTAAAGESVLADAAETAIEAAAIEAAVASAAAHSQPAHSQPAHSQLAKSVGVWRGAEAALIEARDELASLFTSLRLSLTSLTVLLVAGYKSQVTSDRL